MIFVTVGTHHQPFQRLLDALTALDSRQLVVQHGPGTPPPRVARAVPYMEFGAMIECFEEADAVITHAGVGSVICAKRAGHVPLVVPRRQELGEHVDDHQAELTRALADRGSVVPVWDTAALRDMVAAAPRRGGGGLAVNAELIERVRQALLGPAQERRA